MEVVELRGVVEESRVASAQLVKTKEELARAEDQIALLVEKLDDITKEAELSSIGQDQLDNLRAAVAMKAKENRWDCCVVEIVYSIWNRSLRGHFSNVSLYHCYYYEYFNPETTLP